MIEFGSGSEPWSVGRHNARRWLHCLVRDTSALPPELLDELQAWLADRGAELGRSLLITRDEHGTHRVHVAGGAADVGLADLPVWLQRPPAESVEAKPAKPAKAARRK